MSDKVLRGFNALDEKLKLNPLVHAKARSIRAVIEEVLRSAGLLETGLLQGSYGRKTMRPPLKDVDLVVVLPSSLADRRNQPGMSQWAMSEIRTALEGRGGLLAGVRFDVTDAPAHALQLTFPGLDFTFDLVPAFETEEADDGWLYIADREKDQWTKRSDVRRLRDRVRARNKDCGGVWVNQVRQAKHSLDLDHEVNQLVCGLLVESLAYDVVSRKVASQEAMAAIFAAGAQKLTGAYFGLSQDDLTRKWTPAQRAQVVAFFAANGRRAAEAIRLEAAGDQVGACGVWREVFGEDFPVPDVSFVERLKTVGLVGGAVTPDGRLTTAPGNARPARPWRAVGIEEGMLTDKALRPLSQPQPSQSPAVSMDDLMADPDRVADALGAGTVVWGTRDVATSKLCDGYAVKLELDLLPLPDAASEGFEVERVRVVATRDRQVLVYPIGHPGRTWRHRNDAGKGALCLQYPGDDATLLWLWDDGLEELLTRVRLHLLSEEVYRRDGTWPGEELPHGLPEDGVVWPVASPAMRRALKKWSR